MHYVKMRFHLSSVAALAALAVGNALDNGKGITPPMGWRSYNWFNNNVNQSKMVAQMDGIVKRTRTVNGVPTSLKDLGYTDVGLDDAWQACGSYGPNKYTFHNADGFPMVDTTRYPDFINMTSYAHSLGLTAGWYGNNCICKDHCSDQSCYWGDVAATIEFGFDSLKLDGCGAEMDLTYFAELFNASGKSILIENCHWGDTVPNATWCPWNYFRTSGDIEASYSSVIANLLTTVQWAKSGLSQPGCWAYPDMLEVGDFTDPVHPSAGGLSYTEMKTHFNAWCIVSSPLILSHDMNNDTQSDAIWPIITNTEAIAVDQAWFGYSGSVFEQSNATLELSETVAVPTWQYFYKPIDSNHTAVLLMNHDTKANSLTLDFSTIPGVTATTVSLRDLDLHQDLGSFNGQYTATNLASHDSRFLMVSF